MSTDLNAEKFHNEEAARKFLESVRWPDGPVCPHCGTVNKAYATKRAGVYRCGSKDCRKDFTVMVGTVFERSHIPLHKWLHATALLTASKKGMSAHQMHRMLGITYKSAWFMMHRIRESMIMPPTGPLGEGGKFVESDETYIGRKPGRKKAKAGAGHKLAVMALVERGGNVRSFYVENMDARSMYEVLAKNVSREAHLRTDELAFYRGVGWNFASHETVKHSEDEYVRGDAHTNTIEGYFSIFKRGMRGIYQHCGEQHLKRYLTEFDFRYSNRKITDKERAILALKGAEGKRLTYGGSQAR